MNGIDCRKKKVVFNLTGVTPTLYLQSVYYIAFAFNVLRSIRTLLEISLPEKPQKNSYVNSTGQFLG